MTTPRLFVAITGLVSTRCTTPGCTLYSCRPTACSASSGCGARWSPWLPGNGCWCRPRWCSSAVHKRLGHNKTRFGKLFYKRHTGDHHSFFVETLMPYETPRDWRVILFPAWLIVLFSLPTFAAWWLLSQLDGNLAGLFAGSMLLGYMTYEVVHACEHLPAGHPVSRLPWIRQMRRLHALHHRRELMHSRNFGIVHPLMDWLYGTLHWEPEPTHRQNRQQHRIRIDLPAEQVLEYAAAPCHWPEWHPSSLHIYGREGVLIA